MIQKSIYKINSDRTIPWNEIPELPIDDRLYRTVTILEALVTAKSALALLHGRSTAIPNQAIIINTISLQEAKLSSQIENVFTTDDELYYAFCENTASSLVGSPKEILRYREAIWKGYNCLETNHNLFNESYFVEIYKEIKKASDGFRPPFLNTVIKQGGSGAINGTVAFTPPRGNGIIDNLMKNLILFINDDKQFKIDPLIKMAIAHFQFEAIHPFRDGNGRTGRIFNIHILNQKGLLDLPILFLSKFILENKADYYENLTGVWQRGDWQSWILYMLKAVEVTSLITYQKINEIISLKDAILKTILEDSNIRKSELLLQHIFSQPFTKVLHLTQSGLYAENTARNYLNILCEMKVLNKKTISGHHYYENIELVRILAE